ncbi:MAG: hypothetical protein K2Z81_19245 [Cyanobacteria bacterium]|nr:hypothetical protein [Cyanobacteriota bacterium]
MENRIGSFIKLESEPSKARVGSGVMWAAIVVGLCFMCLWLIVAAWVVQYNLIWALVLGGSALAFSFFLCFMGYTLIRDSRRKYSIELTECEAVLNVYDGLAKKKCTQMVLLNDVSFAEYYPYCDTACVILHTPYAHMEIPLWPFARSGSDVMDYLAGRDVKIINVQSDEPIPV